MQTYEITKDWIVKKLISSLKALYENERKLLTDELGERAVIFRLGLIMAKKFKPADVYAEYNKKHDTDGNSLAKSLGDLQSTSYPDLLVFSNENNDNRANKLVIEAKMGYQDYNCEEIERDKKKLTYFTQDNKEYRYMIGAHILLDKDFFVIIYFENGTILSAERYDKTPQKWKKRSGVCRKYNSRNEFKSILR